MTRKHNELVEEIRLLWCEECADGLLNSKVDRIYDEEWETTCATGAEDLCGERARKVVARVVEGPLLGEVGRSRIWARSIKYIHREGREEYWLRVEKECYEAQSIIAFRPTGTGEEKDENRQDDSGS